MKKLKLLLLCLMPLMVTGTITAQNMSRYITLTVQQGQQIQLDLKADSINTAVKIVSGSVEQNIIVGTSWTGINNYTTGSTTMTIYGDITKFDCSGNNSKLTDIDLSNNTELRSLFCQNNYLFDLDVSNNTKLDMIYCYGNQFSTRAIDDIYCSLPNRGGKTEGWIEPLLDSADSNSPNIIASNNATATHKNWKVKYYNNDSDITGFTGRSKCPKLNISRHITLTVQQGQQIRLNLLAGRAKTPVKIVSGSVEQNILVGTSWIGSQYYRAGANTMTIYGDITRLISKGNNSKLTAIDLSNNTRLKELDCSHNSLTTLDVSNNTQLYRLNCNNNSLTNLDVSGCTKLIELNCQQNSLTDLDVSSCNNLEKLSCNGNQFSTQAIDDIYCGLPNRQIKMAGWIKLLYNSADSNSSTVLASNASSATSKNWKVKYYHTMSDITGFTGSYVCPANMSRYVTLKVHQGQQIQLNLKAFSTNTTVKIVSGSVEQNVTVGTSWTGNQNYIAGADSMIIYGDITGFDCRGNNSNLTAIDISNNTELRYLDCSQNSLTYLDVTNNKKLIELNCQNNSLEYLDLINNTDLIKLCFYGNVFSTQGIDNIYCSLPNRAGKSAGRIYPLFNSSDSYGYRILASNASNATDKNWKVKYYNNSDITGFTGSYTCPALNMSRYITLTVEEGKQINLNLKAGSTRIPVKIVSGSVEQNVRVGTYWTGNQNYMAEANTMTIYGDITQLDCHGNNSNLTDIDISNNTELRHLDCSQNSLTDLDVSNNTKLRELYCTSNHLTTLDVSNNTNLIDLYCINNHLTTLDVSNNVNLTTLCCKMNYLTDLDISNNTELSYLYCQNNYLTYLDASNNTKLDRIYCYSNPFSTHAIDDIYCSLPNRVGKEEGWIEPIWDSTYNNNPNILASNIANATNKNWKVKYCHNDKDIIGFTGSYVCGTPHPVNMSRYITLTVEEGEQIMLDLKANIPNSSFKIVSGSTDTTVILDNDWTGYINYTAGANTMTIYGDITQFDCSYNYSNLTAINLNNNTKLRVLYCQNNSLTDLDVSNNTKLDRIYCQDNSLTNLDLKNNTRLTGLYCHNNNFSSQAIDNIYCNLPDRTGKEEGWITPLYYSDDINSSTILASNAVNAANKNWKAKYYNNDSDIIGFTGSYVCGTPHPVNMSRYITLTVEEGEQIGLKLKAGCTNNSIRIVSGSTDTTVIVDNDWTSFSSYMAGANTMTIYGDITQFNCSENYSNITAIDISNNTELTVLYCTKNYLTYLDLSNNTELKMLKCYDNQFSTQAIDNIYCNLPDRVGKTEGIIILLKNSHSNGSTTVLASNIANATNKNWKVKYYNNDSDIIGFTGSYVCGTPHPVNMSRYITLTVEEGEQISLNLKAGYTNNSIRIASGSTDTTVIVDNNWTGFSSYMAGANTMTIYGDITQFDCHGNNSNLTDIDISNNTGLKILYCQNNSLTYLNVSNNTELTTLYCQNNSLADLYLSDNEKLQVLYCQNNSLTYLNVSNNTKLTTLYCQDNSLADLYLSDNEKLQVLYCQNNSLMDLDISNNTKLDRIYCHGNQFTTQAIDNIYCDLPDRGGKAEGWIEPLFNSADSNSSTVLASNDFNATSKNWKVKYSSDNSDIIGFTGSYICGTPHPVNMSRYITLRVQQGEQIELALMASIPHSSFKIVSGSTDTTVILDNYMSNLTNYMARDTSMTVYGNLKGFNCSENYSNITAIDISNNTELRYLACYQDSLTDLDVSNCNNLGALYCYNNQLTTLDVSNCNNLEVLSCYNNQLTALDVSDCNNLGELSCYYNQFSTQAIDNIYCSLPDRVGKEEGRIKSLYDSADSNSSTILASNASNVTAKNWKVKYGNNSDIIGFTGSYICGTPYITVSTSTLSMIAAGEEKTINVTSNTSWTASSSDTWLTLSATSGTNNGSVTATAAANTGTTARTATVTFTAGTLTETVTVTQDGATPILTANPTTLSMIAAGEEKTINVTSNTSWTASSSDTWLTLSATSGTNNGSVTATAAANTGTTARTATVTFTAGSLTETVTVTQDGATPILTVNPATLSMIAAGEEKTINVTSNTSWTASSSDTWLTLSATSGTNNGSVTATAAANTDTTARTATVTFTAGSLTETVTVTQDGATPILTANPTTLSMIAAGEEKTINVTSNTSWTASSSDTWLTLSATSGTNNGSVTATAAANTGTTARTATVTFTAGSITETVTVTQDGATSTNMDIIDQENKVILYPNPIENILYVDSDVAVERISIYTTSGALVSAIFGSDSIDTSDLLPAIYIVKVETAQGVTIEKIVKNKK